MHSRINYWGNSLKTAAGIEKLQRARDPRFIQRSACWRACWRLSGLGAKRPL